MSFNVIPKGADQSPNTPTQPSPAAQAARERAISRMIGSNPTEQTQETAVMNPNKVSPEEMGALSPDKTESDLAAAVEGQNIRDDSTAIESDKAAAAPPAKEDALSTQYAVLARKEKSLRVKVMQQDTAIKAREAAIQAREEALKAKEAEYQTGYISKSRLTEDTWNTLQDAGIGYDKLTEMALSQSNADPQVRAHIQRLEAKLEQQIQAVKDEQIKSSKNYEDSQRQAYQQAVSQIRNDARALVTSDPNFETIVATDSIDDVVELIEETFRSGLDESRPKGTLLSVQEAAQLVEDHLEEEALKLARLKKIQLKLQPATPKMEAKPAEAKTEGKQQQMKTLTNTVGATRPLTARERALLAFKGERSK